MQCRKLTPGEHELSSQQWWWLYRQLWWLERLQAPLKQQGGWLCATILDIFNLIVEEAKYCEHCDLCLDRTSSFVTDHTQFKLSLHAWNYIKISDLERDAFYNLKNVQHDMFSGATLQIGAMERRLQNHLKKH